MKIYINNFNLNILDEIANKFSEYKTKTETFVELYTDESIYRVEDKNVYLLSSLDKDIKIHKNYYENFTLIVDASTFTKTFVTSIQGDKHLSFQTTLNYHSLNKTGTKKTNKTILYMVIKYYNDKPCDFYFEIDQEIDINDNTIKNEIIEFLSVLN